MNVGNIVVLYIYLMGKYDLFFGICFSLYCGIKIGFVLLGVMKIKFGI